MSDLSVVGERNRSEVLAALARGGVIAVALDGGYHLAALPQRRDAIVVALSRPSPSLPEDPFQIMVGLRTQATSLATTWNKETRVLTDRMWPGPLTVIVPSHAFNPEGSTEGVVRITMPASRSLRSLCRESGPLAIAALRHPDGLAFVAGEEVAAQFTTDDLALIVDGGTCRGPGPSVVDCTVSPPVVRHIGAYPESYVDGALMMGNRRRGWRTKKGGSDVGPPP